MIFDLLTSSQGHQFDPRVKIFTCTHFVSTSPSIWYATWPCSKKFFCPPEHPQVPSLGHDQGVRTKISFDMFYLLEHTQSLVEVTEPSLTADLQSWPLSFSIYCQTLTLRVLSAGSGLQDESLQVTISKLCTNHLYPLLPHLWGWRG